MRSIFSTLSFPKASALISSSPKKAKGGLAASHAAQHKLVTSRALPRAPGPGTVCAVQRPPRWPLSLLCSCRRLHGDLMLGSHCGCRGEGCSGPRWPMPSPPGTGGVCLASVLTPNLSTAVCGWESLLPLPGPLCPPPQSGLGDRHHAPVGGGLPGLSSRVGGLDLSRDNQVRQVFQNFFGRRWGEAVQLWDLICLTRDWTCGPCSGIAKSYTGPPRKVPKTYF